MDDLMRKAAGLLRDAADQLRNSYSPEKEASDVADQMVTKGFIGKGERDVYLSRLVEDPMKLAQARDGLGALPSRMGAPIAEVSSTVKAAGSSKLDAFDKFLSS